MGHALLRTRGRRGIAPSPHYDILLDGERAGRAGSEEEVRAWIAKYRQDHEEDDPAAAHIQILERGALAWLSGGKLIDRERFL